MGCRQARRKVSAFMDHELDEASARQLELHLLQCSECREILSDFKELDHIVSGLPWIDPGPDFARQMVRMVSETAAARGKAEHQGNLSLFERLSSLAQDFMDLVSSGRCPATGTLDEFSDFPPLSIGHAYFNLLDLPARG